MKRKSGCLFWILALLAAGIILLVGGFVVMNRETRALDSQARAGLPGAFVDLPGGVTHYQWSGPEGGPVVVLVPGFSIASYMWERTAAGLAQAGYRVLTYDLYGRGYSDRPAGPYNLDRFTTQLDDLLTALRVDRPVNLAGISMGGYIAAAYAARRPERVERLALFAPQVEAMGSDPRMGPMTTAGLGDFLFAVYVEPYVLADDSGEFYSGRQPEDWQARYQEMMQYAGFRGALIATLRDLNGDPFEQYRRLGQTELPVLLLWGQDDTTNPAAGADRVAAAIPQAYVEIVPQAKHMLPVERAEQVNPLLVEFFR